MLTNVQYTVCTHVNKCAVYSMYVTLKDRKRLLSGKTYHNALWHFYKQPQHEIVCCGCL